MPRRLSSRLLGIQFYDWRIQMREDPRLVGETAENIFLSLLNQRGILAASFDTQGLDGIVYDRNQEFFKVGVSPYYVQIKCRGSKTGKYSSQGHSISVFNNIKNVADELGISTDSLYFVVGFYLNSDIRTIRYFCIPFLALDRFKSDTQYRFTVEKCMKEMQSSKEIFQFE
jgi:hypothetical protein